MASDQRRQHRRRVLGELLKGLEEGVTQPDIERETGLGRASVAAALTDLRPVLHPDKGPETLAPSRGGRPARLIRIRDDVGAVGIDFGRTHIRVGVQALSHAEPSARDIDGLEELNFDVARKPKRALDLAAGLLRTMLHRKGTPASIAGICVGLAAPVDCDGRVRIGPFQRWADLTLFDELRSRLDDDRLADKDLKLLVNNDANLALKAELRWGAAKKAGTAIYLKWATGIGTAACVSSRVIRGSGGIAGELGHTAVEETEEDMGKVCDWCGLHCLESVASVGALRPKVPRALLAAIARDPEHEEHEELVRDIDRAGTLIGKTLAPAVSVLNPSVVIVGGLGPESFPDLCVPPVRRAIEESVLESIERDVKVCAGLPRHGSGVVGALAAVFDELVPGYLLAKL